jgi:acyl carrier protein
MEEPACKQQLEFWRQRFSSAPLPRLPNTDMPRRSGKSGQGGAHWIRIPPAITQQLREVARGMDVTLSMLTFGVYALTMSQVIGSRSIVIANPIRGRQQPETEDVMGCFNNVLPVSLEVDFNLSLPAFMRYVKQELLTMMNFQQVPFERLMAQSGLESHIRAVGPYQAMFSFQDARERPRSIGSLQNRQMYVMQRGATDDIGVWLLDKPQGMEGALIYNADIYLRETGAQLRDRYLEVLYRVVDHSKETLAELATTEGSSTAAYLRKLAAIDPIKTVAPGNGAAGAQKNVDVLLNPEHAQLAQIWASVIGIDVNEIRATDNFFDLGGDSLLVLRAIQQTERTLGYRVNSRRYLFENLGQIATSGHQAADGSDITDLGKLPLGNLKGAPRSEGLLSTLGSWLRKE